jgi:TatD DNase family protein
VAVGEIGLDYHYDLDPRNVQAERFERQLELAVRFDLPVVIHVREAHDDMAAILEAHPRNRGVIHSFTGGPAEAERYLAIGWHLAFNGVLTFKNADDVREAARCVPLDRLLVETDSPYLAPGPKRGARCEPAFVVHTLQALAAARGEDLAVLESATTANARTLFGLNA